MILYLAGLQNISTEIYEASMIDGATKTQTFMKITLPLLKPVTSMIVTLTLINTIQIFDHIFVMTNGGPGTSTLTLVQYLYGTAFQNYDIGYGATLEIAILVILILLIKLQSKLIKVDD
jgi:multiple sugar transport system permease protein